MRRGQACLILLGVLIVATGPSYPGRVLGKPTDGYKTSLIAIGRFGAINVSSSFPHGLKARGKKRLWLSLQQTHGKSDVYVQNNVWAPGRSSGWHSHPGHSLIIVTAGPVTEYEGHDPSCTGHVYKTGMGVVDPGGDHVHILRNEGSVEARTVAVQIVPANAARRIEASDPGNCHF
jgi:quercetin dioxygenase-like cupin family protein